MKEIRAILEYWRTYYSGSQPPLMAAPVLATVVNVRGSAYRRPGARMLLLPDGNRIGSVSGGCLEGDLSKKAWWWTEGGRAALRTYDSTSDDDAVQEFGLGCNGVVEVLLERLGTDPADRTLAFLEQCLRMRMPGAMATVIRARRTEGSAQVGARLFLRPDGLWDSGIGDSRLESQLSAEVTRAKERGESRLLHSDGFEVFIEHVPAPAPIVLFGAGHDAIPLVTIAKEVGWHVTVVDGRAAYARAARFPLADSILVSRPEDPMGGAEIGPDSAIVMMTHSYPQDREILRRVIPLCPRYVGLLGPKRRTERLLREGGIAPGKVALHAPAGLDIGADTPELIALSIVAEIQAVIAGRSGGMLKMRPGPIYEPVREVHTSPGRHLALA